MKCPFCGTDCNSDAKFCEKCGKTLTGNLDVLPDDCRSENDTVDYSATKAASETAEQYCPRCGNLIEPGMSSCPVCGWQMVDAETVELPFPDSEIADKLQKIEQYFKSWRIWLILGIPTCGIGFIVSSVFGFMLLYQYWKFIPKSESKTTPGEAVGYLFIPFFNLYWQFVAYWQFSKIFKTVYNLNNDSLPNLALAICICSLVSGLPYIGIGASLAVWIMAIIWNVKIYKSVIALLKSRLSQCGINN